MRKKSSNQPNKSGSTVTPIRQQPPQIEPPEGVFDPRSAFGHTAFKDGNEGRLVRLAEVLRWIERSKSLPRLPALKLLCDGLTSDVMQWLFWLSATDYAKPVPTDCQFGYKTANQLRQEQASLSDAARQRERQSYQTNSLGIPHPRWNDASGALTYSPQEATEPGVPALLKALNAYWKHQKFNAASKAESLDDPRFKRLTPLAIRLDKAHAIWGYGRELSAIEGTEKTANAATDTNAEWSDVRIYNRRTGLENTPKPMRTLLEEMGLAVTPANERKVRYAVERGAAQSAAADAAKKKPATPFDGLIKEYSQDKKTARKA